MHSTHDFIVNGVITSSPDVARAELAGEETDNRKVVKVFDLHAICEASDALGGLFRADGEFTEAIAEHCACGEVDVFVALLQALSDYDNAAALLSHHIETDQCEAKHPNAAEVLDAAA
ncbi:hypothetical protein [Rhodococcus sp. 27YEA6]|uniref:hypothetical protein n=1 Tax=Rhodococcus sp. 27YEA6 TaxID=3156273 RepID=UPI0038343E0B